MIMIIHSYCFCCFFSFFFFFNDTATTEIYTLSLHDALPISGGVTAVARSAGSSLAPLFAGRLLNLSMLNAPFFLAGGLKIVYDVLLYRSFRASQANEEK